MTVKEINDNFNKISKEIQTTLDNSIDPNDPTIIYELDQESIDERSYDYYIDAYDKNGATYEMNIERIQKNGEIYGYINELGEYWTVSVSDIFDIQDKLQLLNIYNQLKL